MRTITAQKTLGQTPLEYQMNIFSLWLEWCQKKSHSEDQLQTLLSNAPLFNWFQSQLDPLEAFFMQDYGFHKQTIGPTKMLILWWEDMRAVHKFNSKALFRAALKPLKTSENDS